LILFRFCAFSGREDFSVINIEYFANKVKAEQKASNRNAGVPPTTAGPLQVASVVNAGQETAFDLGGPKCELPAAPEDTAYWVMKATLPAHASVLLPSHGDAESFYLISGEAQFLAPTTSGLQWKTLRAGDLVAGNALITVRRQELCTNWSAPSAPVRVDPKPSTLLAPVVASPLFECGAAVHVSDLHPGTTVYVYSTLLGAPIGTADVFTREADVPVASLLIKGDQIYAEQKGCGLVSSKSAPVTVQPLPEVVAPVVLRAGQELHVVTVGNLIAGARVDVYVNGAWRGSAIAGAATVEVRIQFGPLNIGDEVAARQWICNAIGGPGEPVKVISSAGFFYTTQHFDVRHPRWNPFETLPLPCSEFEAEAHANN